MPLFRIRMINSDFDSLEETHYPTLDLARRAAIATATKVAGESIASGEPSAAVELQICADEVIVARHVVTLSVSKLMAEKQPSI